jgi:hypothetical protein
MRIYAERPGRAGLQLLADLLALGWIWLTAFVARTVHDFVLAMQGPARTLAGAGESVRGAFDDAARTAASLPFVGDDLARALGAGTGAGESLVAAGQEQMEAIARVAFGTTVATVVLGAMPVLFVWLPLRVRYARLAQSAVTARAVDSDLLALRALTRRPVRQLMRVAPDPATSWRRGERPVLHALAALELRSLGLRAPRTPPD